MPNLEKILPQDDLGYLKIVASFWGLELESDSPPQAAEELAAALCDAELLEEIVSTLPEEAQTALGALIDSSGRIAWDSFTRRFGELRQVGPGKRDREKPHLRPISATEILWYRALLARAFFETERGPQEFAFIPDDVLEALAFIGFKSEEQPPQKQPQPTPTARRQTPRTPRHPRRKIAHAGRIRWDIGRNHHATGRHPHQPANTGPQPAPPVRPRPVGGLPDPQPPPG
jgi:hypothetical protein